MIKVSKIPYLSHIEHVEALRSLGVPRRMLYAVLSLVAVVLAFVVMVGVSIALAFLLVDLFTDNMVTIGDQFLVAASVLSTYMILIGGSSNPIPRTIVSGDTLSKCLQRAFRSGIMIGAVGGFFFGLIWISTVRISRLYTQLNTFYDYGVDGFELLLYALAMMVAVAVPFAVFRAFYALSGFLTLHMVQQSTVSQPVATQTQ